MKNNSGACNAFLENKLFKSMETGIHIFMYSNKVPFNTDLKTTIQNDVVQL